MNTWEWLMSLLFGAPVVAAIVTCGLLTASAPLAAQGNSDATREGVERALIALDSAAQAEIGRNGVPGLAIAVVFEDQVLFAKGYGVKNTSSGEAVDAD